MTIDLEDWFHTQSFNGVIPKSEWGQQTNRVVRTTNLILNHLDRNQIKATFFVLGWVAEREPGLIKTIQQEGHEIASHGYEHDIVYHLTPEQFRNDIRKSSEIIQNITGEKLLGYRAPNFSITDWAIEILVEEGFRYDSSLFPTFFHDRYGKLSTFKIENKPFFELKKGFWEVPLSSLELSALKLPWSGGGYFRLLPYNIFKIGVSLILKKKGIYNFYIHPWEFDPEQPKIKAMPKSDHFRHYNNLHLTTKRFSLLINSFPFQSVKDLLPL